MKLFFYCICVFLFVFVSACSSVDASEKVAQNIVKDVIEVKKTVQEIKKNTPKECHSDLFLNQLKTIEKQADDIKFDTNLISDLCQKEKNILKEKIKNRDFFIFFIFIFILFVFFLKIKKAVLK